MDRQALGQFLRRRREALQPADVGLAPFGRRRTPGLRREEVAALAHCSIDHYTRLEQARGSAPSRNVLHAVARALRLDETERAHLLALADDPERLPGGPPSTVADHVSALIGRLPLTAAVVRDARCDVLAWNPPAERLLNGLFAGRNLLRGYFLHPDPAVRYLSEADEGPFVQQAVGALRRTAERYPHDARTRRLVDDLRAGSARFRELWSSPSHPGGRSGRKTIRHPAAGPLTLNYDVLDIPDADHQVILLTAAPGTPAAEKLADLVGAG